MTQTRTSEERATIVAVGRRGSGGSGGSSGGLAAGAAYSLYILVIVRKLELRQR